MADIRVSLFGSAAVTYNGHSISFPYKKAEALLYYLVVTKSATRDEIVNMFWGGNDEETAKKNLRNAVYVINKIFGQNIIISPQRSLLLLNPSLEIETDLSCLDSENEDLFVKFYTGEFLSDLLVKDAEDFDSWVLNKRAYYKDAYIKRLYNMLGTHIRDKNFTKAIEYAEHIIKIDVLEEKAYRVLMNIYFHQNQSGKALKVYNILKQNLKDMLGISPDAKTTELYNKLLHDRKIHSDKNLSSQTKLFYGRQNELEGMTANFNNFIQGIKSKPQIIIGEAGIGKTRLKDEFLSSVKTQDIYLIETSCFQEEQSYILKPWNSVFSQISGIIEEDDINIPALWASITSMMFPLFSLNTSKHKAEVPKSEYPLDAQAMDEIVIKVLQKVSKNKKMLLVFEDIHWIDARSMSLLRSLILGRNKNVMVVATCRNEFKREINDFTCSLIKYDAADKIVLERFNKAQVTEMLLSSLPDNSMSEELNNKLFEETEGNTFFIIEFINNLITKNEIGILSPKVHDILKTRFSGLSHECQNILDILSVSIDPVSYRTLQTLCSLDDFDLMDIIDELKFRYLIKEAENKNDITFDFTHRKLKEFIYSELSPSRKKLLHFRTAKYIESQLNNDYSDMILYSKLIHYYTNSGHKVDALKYSVMNADSYLQSTQELFPLLVDTGEEEKKHSLVSRDEAVKFLNVIEVLLNQVKLEEGTNSEIAKLEISYLLMKGRYHIKYGEYDEGVSIVKQMIRYALFYKDNKNALKGYKLMIYYCIQTFNEEDMAEYIEKSLEIAEAHSLFEDEGTIFRFKGLLNIFTGNYKDAEYFLKQSIQVFEMLNLASGKYILSIAAAYNYLGEIKRHNRQFKEAIEYYDKSIEMCDNAKVLRGITTFCKNAGQAAYEMGDYEKSRAYLERASEISQNLDSIWGRSTVNGYLSLVLIREGKYSEGLAYLKKADMDCSILKIPYEVGVLYRVKAEIKKMMENDIELCRLFSEHLNDNIEAYCRKGIEILSTLKGAYEIAYMEALL